MCAYCLCIDVYNVKKGTNVHAQKVTECYIVNKVKVSEVTRSEEHAETISYPLSTGLH